MKYTHKIWNFKIWKLNIQILKRKYARTEEKFKKEGLGVNLVIIRPKGNTKKI